MSNHNQNYVFLVGSPRSGTTILQDVLSQHSKIAGWHEPYFIWNWETGNLDSDVRTPKHATARTKQFVRNEFSTFLKNSKKQILLEKLPKHSLQIPFVHAIFPNAKWIHIVRDGRNVALSIQKKWEHALNLTNKKDIKALLKNIRYTLNKQIFWRNKLQILFYELKNVASLNPFSYLSKSKWGGPGWGPRFTNWEESVKTCSVSQIAALQWKNCTESILESQSLINPSNWLELRYEDLTSKPDDCLTEILNFLELDPLNIEILQSKIKKNAKNLWQSEFSQSQFEQVKTIIEPTMLKLGYEL
jgi:hypothetical protein